MKIRFPISFGPVEVVPTTAEHLPAFWEILQDWEDFWADKGLIDDLEHFETWYGDTAIDSLTGLDAGEVIGGGYLDTIYPGSYASANVFKRKGYLNPRMVSSVVKSALPYWFDKYKLEALRGITRQRSAISLCKRMGFRVDGTFRHWAKINGEWCDYTMFCILRSEL